jgi:hypothetical protein
MLKFILLILLTIQISCATRPQKCTINLDEAAENRWTSCINQYLAPMERVNKIVRKLPIINYDKISADLKIIADNPEIYLDKEMANEIKGIAKAADQDITTILMFALLFEAINGCSTAIIEDKDKSIYLARNTDFYPSDLKELIIEVNFQKNQKTIFKAISFAGYPGVLVGYAPNRLAATLNKKENDYHPDKGEFTTSPESTLKLILQNKDNSYLKKQTRFITWEIRQALQQGIDYEQAKEKISNITQYSTAGYITLVGTKPHEGIVLNRNSYKPDNEIYIDYANKSLNEIQTIKSSKKIDLISNQKLIVQTNKDHCQSCSKCSELKAKISKIKDKISYKKLLDIFSKSPAYVNDLTVITLHSTIMNPKKGIFKSRFY